MFVFVIMSKDAVLHNTPTYTLQVVSMLIGGSSVESCVEYCLLVFYNVLPLLTFCCFQNMGLC